MINLSRGLFFYCCVIVFCFCGNLVAASLEVTGKSIGEENQKVLKEIMKSAGVNYIKVTGTSRTSLRQAELMYVCSVKGSCAKYGNAGRKVLQVYKANHTSVENNALIELMHIKVKEVMEQARQDGELQHLFDDVVALDLSKFKEEGKITPADEAALFIKSCKAHERVKRCFGPGEQDPEAFHIEIKK